MLSKWLSRNTAGAQAPANPVVPVTHYVRDTRRKDLISNLIDLLSRRSRCKRCGKRVSSSGWRRSVEWDLSHYCGPCLNGIPPRPDGCYEWARQCEHFDDLDCFAAEEGIDLGSAASMNSRFRVGGSPNGSHGGPR